MKKILLLFSILLFAFNLSAQNYDSNFFLRQAYSALEEGKIEKAQSSYNVYKKASGKIDLDFETLIKNADANVWKRSCYIIKVNDTLSLAVQHVDKQQIPVSHHIAEVKAESSRLGNFTDWRLPSNSELKIILPNLDSGDVQSYYWTGKKQTSFCFGVIKKINGKIISRPPLVEITRYEAVNNVTYETIETYYECKKDGIMSESRGNKSICHKYIIVRTF